MHHPGRNLENSTQLNSPLSSGISHSLARQLSPSSAELSCIERRAGENAWRGQAIWLETSVSTDRGLEIPPKFSAGLCDARPMRTRSAMIRTVAVMSPYQEMIVAMSILRTSGAPLVGRVIGASDGLSCRLHIESPAWWSSHHLGLHEAVHIADCALRCCELLRETFLHTSTNTLEK